MFDSFDDAFGLLAVDVGAERGEVLTKSCESREFVWGADVEAARDAAYRTGSTRLDTVIALLGKTTEQGQQLARIRCDIRRGPNAPAETTPKP